VSVVLRGTRLAASAVVVEGPARDEALAEYAGGSPRIARATRDAAVVVFTPTR